MRGSVRLITAAAIGVGTLVGLAPTAGAPTATQGGCASPLPPIYASHRDYDGAPVVQDFPEQPTTAPPTDGRSLTAEWGHAPDIDTDADGKVDQVADTEDGIKITRGDGVVRLVGSGPSPVPIHDYDIRFTPGDLDGDGRDDLLLFVSDGGQAGTWFALSGATAPGTYAIADAAVRLPADRLYPEPGHTAILGAVDDQVGGPGPDYLVRNTDGGGLTPGEALLAPGPGGTLDHFPITVAIPGELRGEFDLGGARPALLLAEGDYGVGAIGLRLFEDGKLVDIDDFGGHGFYAYEQFTAVSSPLGDLLVSRSSDRGGGETIVVWNLSDRCGATAAGGTGATPATPVDGAPSFTG